MGKPRKRKTLELSYQIDKRAVPRPLGAIGAIADLAYTAVATADEAVQESIIMVATPTQVLMNKMLQNG